MRILTELQTIRKKKKLVKHLTKIMRVKGCGLNTAVAWYNLSLFAQQVENKK